MRRVAKQWRTEVYGTYAGAVSTFTYDAKDRLTQDATSAPLAHTYTFTYDSRDNILTNSESGGVVQMNYDAASRLTTSTAGGVTTTYTFDSNGNLTGVNEAGTLTTMVYDKENRLKEHKQGAPGSETAFTYDLNSLKQSTTSGLVTDQLVWDGTDMLGEVPAAHPEGAPLMPTRYNLAQGMLFATTRFEPAATRTDTGADFIGSILTDFDENGDYIAERRNKPYGELIAGTSTTYGWTGNTGSRYTLLQYAEQYNRRRHYSTKLKQWTTTDPLWPEENAYGYVRGRSLSYIDSSGEERSPFGNPIFGSIECTKYWNNYIWSFCHRSPGVLCDAYARQYILRCQAKGKNKRISPTGGMFGPDPSGYRSDIAQYDHDFGRYPNFSHAKQDCPQFCRPQPYWERGYINCASKAADQVFDMGMWEKDDPYNRALAKSTFLKLCENCCDLSVRHYGTAGLSECHSFCRKMHLKMTFDGETMDRFQELLQEWFELCDRRSRYRQNADRRRTRIITVPHREANRIARPRIVNMPRTGR